MNAIWDIINISNEVLWNYIMIVALLGSAVYFTIRSRAIQFTMIGEMFRQIASSTEHNRADFG